MSNTARDYQDAAIMAVDATLSAQGGALCQMATGTGKTFVQSRIASMYAQRGRVLCLVGREVLLFQLARAMYQWTGLEVDIEKAELKVSDNLLGKKKIIWASVQTLVSGANENYAGRMEKFDPMEFSLIITDECHHAMADSYLKVFHYFRSRNPDVKLAGFTATPERGDKKSLGIVYGHIAYSYPYPKAVSDGWLVPLRHRTARVESVNLDEVKKSMGDLQDKQLQIIMSVPEAVRSVAAEIVSHYGGRPSLVFDAGITHGKLLVSAINALRPGTAAEVSNGNNIHDRKAIMANFIEQRVPVLVQHDIVSEGFDFPAISRIYNARPTASPSRYAQAVGRGTRPICDLSGLSDAKARRDMIARSNKPYTEVLDFTGKCSKHSLAGALDLNAMTEAMDSAMRQRCNRILEDGLWHEPKEVLERAKRELEDESEIHRNEMLAKRIQELRACHFQKNLQFKVDTRYEEFDPFAVIGYAKPSPPPWMFAQAAAPVGDRERQMLRKWRFKEDEIDKFDTFTARKMVQRLAGRAKNKLATWRQSVCLAKNGIDPTHVSFQEASAIIDGLFKKQA